MTDNNTLEGLQNLNTDGSAPKCRVTSAAALQAFLRQIIQNDSGRSTKRALVQGLVDGNAPFNPAKLRENGRGDACNVNWQTAKSYVEQAAGIFYDLYAESPLRFSLTIKTGDESERGEWQRIMAEVGTDILDTAPQWDYLMQMSQWWMTLHGYGPLWFENRDAVIPRWCKTGDLKVPDNTESELTYWESAFILIDYKPYELYEFIKNPEAAEKVGWDVEYVKKVIHYSMPARQQTGINMDWEWVQEQFKQNSFATYFDTNVIKVAHAFWKEFDGRITHAIVEQETQGSGSPLQGEPEQDNAPIKYLFKKVGRYNSWQEVVHPFYFSKGNGKHYTVNGMGVSMYGALVYENRLRCKLADEAMSPKVMFRPTSESSTPFNITQLGPYMKLPAGWDLAPTPVSGHLEDGITMLNEVTRTTSNNLAQYRQSWSKSQGNPATATQVAVEQRQQHAVAGTQISRYYKQLDLFYTEIVRRLCNLNSTDALAREFQRRCIEQGVPREAFGRIGKVEAYRVSGEGSVTLRQNALDVLVQNIALFPEDGREQILCDWTASRVGQRNVKRYYPTKQRKTLGSEQEADAMLQVAAMKIGVPPVITSEQDPVVFASTFIGACGQAIGTVAQGAKIPEVLAFCELAMPAGIQHMQRFANDPTRQGIYKDLEKMFNEIASRVDQLEKIMQKQMQEAAQQQQNAGPQLPPDVQQKLAIEDAKGQLKLKQMYLSHQQRLQQRKEQHEQQIAADRQRTNAQVAALDVTTAAEVRRGALRSMGEKDSE